MKKKKKKRLFLRVEVLYQWYISVLREAEIQVLLILSCLFTVLLVHFSSYRNVHDVIGYIILDVLILYQ